MERRPKPSDNGGEVRWSKTSWSSGTRRKAKHSGSGGKGEGPGFLAVRWRKVGIPGWLKNAVLQQIFKRHPGPPSP